jgi:hypothetical protein
MIIAEAALAAFPPIILFPPPPLIGLTILLTLLIAPFGPAIDLSLSFAEREFLSDATTRDDAYC